MFTKKVPGDSGIAAELGGPPATSRSGVSPAVRLGGGKDQKAKKKFGGGKFGKGGSHGGFSKGGGVKSFSGGGRY